MLNGWTELLSEAQIPTEPLKCVRMFMTRLMCFMAEARRLLWRGRVSSQDGEPCCSLALWKSGTHLSVNVSLTLGRKSQGHTLHPTVQQTQLDEERHGGPGLRDYQPVHRRCVSSRGGNNNSFTAPPEMFLSTTRHLQMQLHFIIFLVLVPVGIVKSLLCLVVMSLATTVCRFQWCDLEEFPWRPCRQRTVAMVLTCLGPWPGVTRRATGWADDRLTDATARGTNRAAPPPHPSFPPVRKREIDWAKMWPPNFRKEQRKSWEVKAGLDENGVQLVGNPVTLAATGAHNIIVNTALYIKFSAGWQEGLVLQREN